MLTRLRSLSLWRGRSTQAYCAHAPCRADYDQPAPYRRALCRREASLLRRASVVRRTSCGLQREASAACHAAQGRRRSLSLGRRRSTRAFYCARAVPRWLWSAHVLKQVTALVRGLAPSARVRCATCQLRVLAPSKRRVSRGAAVPARLRSLSLGRGRSTRACYCARAVPRWLWSAPVLKHVSALVRGLTPSAPVRGATCQLRPPTPNQRR